MTRIKLRWQTPDPAGALDSVRMLVLPDPPDGPVRPSNTTSHAARSSPAAARMRPSVRCLAAISSAAASRYRGEYDDPGSVYPSPGTVFLAELAGVAIGCVALRDLGSGIGEVKRLSVRPAYRRRGIGQALMVHLHEHADRHRLSLVLDVLATRRHVLALYQDLGYTTIPASASPTAPLIVMERTAPPGTG